MFRRISQVIIAIGSLCVSHPAMAGDTGDTGEAAKSGDTGEAKKEEKKKGKGGVKPYPTDAGDLTITEFMAEPEVVANYYGEWFEIYNASGRNLDLEGLVVEGVSTETGFVIEGSLPIGAGDYLIFCVSDDQKLNGGVEVDYVYERQSGSTDVFMLDENGDAIRLVMDGQTIDEVEWDDADWPVTRNYAHQVNINAYDNEWANDLPQNWCISDVFNSGTAGSFYGTPGEENTLCDASNDDSDGDGYTEAQGDCDDTDPEVNPDVVDGSEESGYGATDDDADCDGVRDDGDIDDDGDGYAEVDGDCDDGNIAYNPDASEISDAIDNDCNGCVDDLDADGDGWTECPGAYEDIDCDDDGEPDILEPFDCSEGDNSIYPCAPEVPYDDVDNDCDGFDECDVDEDGARADPELVCPDIDENGDGIGDCCWYTDEVEVKDPKTGKPYTEYVETEPGDDCDDTNPDVKPDASEGNPETGGTPDGLDNDCDGVVDNPYLDQDGDGIMESAGDCNDLDPTIYHAVYADNGDLISEGAPEDCDDLVDNDCDGWLNEECSNPSGYASIQGGGGFCGVLPRHPTRGWVFLVGALILGLRRRNTAVAVDVEAVDKETSS